MHYIWALAGIEKSMNYLKTVLIFASLIYCFGTHSQNREVKFNTFDKNGKKHGYWKMYVDSNLNQVTDTSKAIWYYYKMIHHGETFRGYIDDFIAKKALSEVTFLSRPKIKKGIILPANGLLKIETVNNIIHSLTFKNGYLMNHFTIFGKSGTSWEELDYSKSYKNNPFSYYYQSPTAFRNKIKKGFFYYLPNRNKRKKDFQVHPVESTRYDYDSSRNLNNGLYNGNFTAYLNSSINGNEPNTESTYNIETKRHSANLTIDSSSFKYEDYYQLTTGNYKFISKNTVAFYPDSIYKKIDYSKSYDFLVFQGCYNFKKDNKRYYLKKNNRLNKYEFEFKYGSLNPFVFDSKTKID